MGGMYIDGLGEKIVDYLVDNNFVKDVSDLYYLKYLSSDRMIKLSNDLGPKVTTNLLQAIEDSKKTTLVKFLFALGIRNASTGTAKRLVEHFKTLDNIRNATYQQLIEVSDIGPVVASSISSFFMSKDNKAIINRLLEAGITWDESSASKVSDKFKGMTFVVTGTLVNYNRDSIKELIEPLGGKTSDSVSKNTTMLVCGGNAGSKLSKAVQLGVKVITEDEFLALVNN